MTDPRVQKLAQVLVNYSLNLQPGEELAIKTNPLAEELNLAVMKEALLAGAHITFLCQPPGAMELLYRYGNDSQLEYISPTVRHIHEHFRAILDIEAEYNTREFSGIDPARLRRFRKSRRAVFTKMIERIGNKDLKWTFTVFPTQANAQEADMSLAEYQEFVYSAGMLDLPDPVAAWKNEHKNQLKLISWLKGKKEVILRGKDIDLRLSIEGRDFEGASGKENFPDGEIFTSPVEESVNGWVRFSYPAIYQSREVIDVELWFEGGKVVREKAAKGQDLLTETLNTDPGARFLGELGIGTNYAIPRFTKNMLFDEKLGGTIHLALGAGFPEVGGKNESGVHWDLLCDMAESEILVDGDRFYQNGKFLIG